MKFKLNYTRFEPFVFGIVLLISIYPNIINTYSPTLDGPAHVYNSNLLNHYFSNPVIHHYYYLNKIPSPNLFDHLFLSLFNLFFNSGISEKIFILCYYISFPLSLRYFIKAYNPQNVFLSIIGIPLSHTCLFYMGFYNFSISFVFLFFAIGLYYKNMHKKEYVKTIYDAALFLMITLTYFSNALSFIYLTGVLAAYEINTCIYFYSSDLKELIRKRILKNALIVLPAFICLVIFYLKIDFPGDNTPNSKMKLLEFLFYFKSINVYEVTTDALYARMLLAMIIFLIGCTVVKKSRSLKTYVTGNFDSLVYFIISGLVLTAYFEIPNGESAGMMTDRLCNLFFISLLLWIVSQKEIRFPKAATVFILIPHFYLLNIHAKQQAAYNKLAVKITESAKYIKENSVVLPINLMSHWIFVTDHFPDYLGSEKPLIILDNYEARLPWFPLNWNLAKIPLLTLNGKETIQNTEWPKSTTTNPAKEIEYVYIFGEINDINTSPGWMDLKTNLYDAYAICYSDNESKITIYKHK